MIMKIKRHGELVSAMKIEEFRVLNGGIKIIVSRTALNGEQVIKFPREEGNGVLSIEYAGEVLFTSWGTER